MQPILLQQGVAVAVDKSQVLALPGWFSPLDFDLFDWFLSQQRKPGDLLEIGVFKGQSAVPIGSHRARRRALHRLRHIRAIGLQRSHPTRVRD